MPSSIPALRCGGFSIRLGVGAILALGLCLTSGCGSFAARGLNADGVRRFEQAQYQDAIGRFQKAIANDPNNADGYYNLAAAYYRLGTVNKRQSDLDQAESYYNQCLDRNPDHAECYRGLAVLLAEQSRSEEAFRLMEGWVDRRPNLPEPKIELARLFDESGDRNSAKERLIEALTIDPDHPRALAALGNIRQQMGEHAQALADYQRSLWHNRFQPEIAARVAALQSTLNTGPVPPSQTRVVGRGPGTLR